MLLPLAVLAALALCQLLTLPLWHDDQALFQVGARVLDAGGLLYRDHWDVKQPAIYALYALALDVFGPAVPQAPVIVLIIALVCATLVVSRLGERLAPAAGHGAWVAPLLTTGALVCRASVFNVGQVEMFVGLPLVLVLWAGTRALEARAGAPGTAARAHATAGVSAAPGVVSHAPAGPRRDRLPPALWWALAALATAAVAALKLILAGIAGLMLVTGLLVEARRSGVATALRSTLVCGLALAAGLVAVAAPYLPGERGALFLWTQFVFPLQAARAAIALPTTAHLLTSAGNWASTVAAYAPAALLAVAAAWPARPAGAARAVARDGRPAVATTPVTATAAVRPDRDSKPACDPSVAAGTGFLVAGCVVWIVAGLLVIVAQRFSWHAYHFTMLLWPVGLLAARGIGLALRRRTLLMRAIVVVAAAGVLVNGARLAQRIADPFRADVDVPAMRAELMPRLTDPACRSAIVFGSPALLLAAQLVPVGPITGQLDGLLSAGQREATLALLRRRAPRYVAVSRRSAPWLAQHWPEVGAWLAAAYRPLYEDSLGTAWYEPAAPRPAAGDGCATTLGPAPGSAHENLRSILPDGPVTR